MGARELGGSPSQCCCSGGGHWFLFGWRAVIIVLFLVCVLGRFSVVRALLGFARDQAHDPPSALVEGSDNASNDRKGNNSTGGGHDDDQGRQTLLLGTKGVIAQRDNLIRAGGEGGACRSDVGTNMSIVVARASIARHLA